MQCAGAGLALRVTQMFRAQRSPALGRERGGPGEACATRGVVRDARSRSSWTFTPSCAALCLGGGPCPTGQRFFAGSGITPLTAFAVTGSGGSSPQSDCGSEFASDCGLSRVLS